MDTFRFRFVFTFFTNPHSSRGLLSIDTALGSIHCRPILTWRLMLTFRQVVSFMQPFLSGNLSHDLFDYLVKPKGI